MFVDWCSQGVCENGGTCSQVANEFRCDCLPNYTGRVCDVLRVTCEVAAELSSKSLFQEYFFPCKTNVF